VGFKPYLKDQLVSVSALTLLVWSYDLQKIVPRMSYDVLSGTLSLYTTTGNKSDTDVLCAAACAKNMTYNCVCFCC